MYNEKHIGVTWEGPQLANSSLALVNRYLCRELIEHNIKLNIIPTQRDSIPETWFADSAKIKALYAGEFESDPEHIRVRQQWPPSLSVPQAGLNVMFQPWEFGSVPKDWVDYIAKSVDEVWVNSQYTKDGYVSSGIPTEKVFSFPLGVDLEIYRPDGPLYGLKTTKKFKFLFVGGTIFRKGIDKLLEAYESSFTAKDDVCLVIKDFGTNTYYKGQTFEETIRKFQQNPLSPEILYFSNDFSPHELAALYRSCDCLVQPYRGEGFGLPILEAMACGTAPIIPNLGPAIEFTTEQTSYRIPASITFGNAEDLHTVHPVQFVEVDKLLLATTMRTVYEFPIETQQMGLRAFEHAQQYSWTMVGQLVIDRLKRLFQSKNDLVVPDHPVDPMQQIFLNIAHKFEGDQNARQHIYSHFLKCFAPGDVMIDLGAGDGTWLTLLNNYGVKGIGVDIDANKVAQMCATGLNAVCANVIDFMKTFDGPLDGLSMLHIVEHLAPQQVLEILYSVRRRLSYRGRILIMTPNFDNSFVAKKNFWLDVTHVRPYPAELLTAMLQELGFRTIVSGTLVGEMDTVVFASLLDDDNPLS